MKIAVIIQARLGSSRLPGKAALDMHGMPLLARVIARCRMVQSAPEVCVATSDLPGDNILCRIAADAGATVYRGPLENVRQRMLGAAKHIGADAFIRVTGDNPFTDPVLLELLIKIKRTVQDCPYLVHDLARTVYGTAAEMVDTGALAHCLADMPEAGREHVTTGLGQLSQARVLPPPVDRDDPILSLTVDTLEQYQSVWSLMDRHGSGRDAVPAIVGEWRKTDRRVGVFMTRASAK